MTRNAVILSTVSLFILFLAGCSGKKEIASKQPPLVTDRLIGLNDMEALPKATIFKMSGNYADNMAVTVNASGVLTYFPAPSDLTAASAPVALGDGWYLNRQGLGANSVFTKYTFEEYRNLKTVPTISELKAAIIPGAKVTQFREIPVRLSDALADPELCKQYIPD